MPRIARLFDIFRSLGEPNPVFRRELRARWRRPVAFLTLFFYAAPTALIMANLYEQRAGHADFVNFAESTQASEIGRGLFSGLLLLQAIALLLFAPALAAPTVAAEREKGLLEALQLAELPARRVVLGKWLAILSFLALLMLVPLPCVSLCFLFGGISPFEFVVMLLLLVVSALNLTAFGLFLSSRSRRPAVAWRDAFVCVVAWSALTFLFFDSSGYFVEFPLFVQQFFAVLSLAHPTTPILFRFPVEGAAPFYFPIDGSPLPLAPNDVLSLNFILQGCAALLWIALAIRAAAKPTKDPLWLERRQWIDKLRARWKIAPRQQPTNIKQRAQRALVAEISLVSGRSYNNPVFGRELRSRTRLRSAPWWMWLLRILLVMYPVLLAIQLFADALDGPYQLATWQKFTFSGLFLLMLYAAVSGAGAFTREREGGTWENLKLSLLQPGEIVRGKVTPLCCVAALLAVPLFVALFSCLRPNFHNWEFFDFSAPMGQSQPNGVQLTLWHFTAALGIIAGAVFFTACTALLISWFSRRTPIAIGLTLLALALLLGVSFDSPNFNQSDDSRYANLRRVALWNPVVALTILTEHPPVLENYMNYPTPMPYMSLPTLSKPPKPAELAYLRQYKTWVADTDRRNQRYQIEYLANAKQAERELAKSLMIYQDFLRLSTFCPLMLFAVGCGELLLICALMRQKFRDEK